MLASLDNLIGSPESANPINNDNAAVFSGRGDFAYTYNAGTGVRDLKDTTDATLTLNGPNPRVDSGGVWTFNFCNLSFTHQTKIVLLNGAVARFFIDSSERPGSGCATTGTLTLTGVSEINYNSATGTPGDPTALQFLVYGSATVTISDQPGLSAALYAPSADVSFTDKTVFYGAIDARSVTASGGLDFRAADVSTILTTSSARFFQRETWAECRSQPTNPSYPESGC
jgi:hypothetical protein